MARIVRFHEYGAASVLEIEKLYVPPPCADEVRIDVKSIGFNRGGSCFARPPIFKRLNSAAASVSCWLKPVNARTFPLEQIQQATRSRIGHPDWQGGRQCLIGSSYATLRGLKKWERVA
jgi:hypothetical protein